MLDTFEGLDPAQADNDEKWRKDFHLNGGFYVKGAAGVRANFSESKHACVIDGSVPATLDQVKSERIAFLSLDMNCAAPEVAALHALWPRLSPSAIVLSDDYCYNGYPGQKAALDTAAAELGATILSLPTGQGLIIK